MKFNRFICFLVSFCCLVMSLSGCKPKVDPTPTMEINLRDAVSAEFNGKNVVDMGYEYADIATNIIDDNYRNYYEIYVGTFVDSNYDGVGDLQGVISKLDYLQDMGVNGIWLMPINPSPSEHKYDVTNYMAIDDNYGTMADFDQLLEECNDRGIKLILDLVINHSSSQHEWFNLAWEAFVSGNTENPYYDYYNFSHEKLNEIYRPINGVFVECHFGDHMPDLNMDSAGVRQEVMEIVDFWLGKGVGGFRLDAAMHIYRSDRAKNVEFWKWFNDYCRSINPEVYTVQEIWSTETQILAYYESETSSVFNYSLGGDGGTIITGIRSMPTDFAFAEQLVSWQNKIASRYEGGIDALFLTNHDNDRSANLLRRNIYAIKHAAALYLLAPGSPFIYYGEEVGMLGTDNDPTRRLPMNWGNHATDAPTGSNNIKQYFPAVNQQVLYENSILGTYKRALLIRNQNPEIARGKLSVISGLGTGFTGFVADYQGSKVAVIHNVQGKPLATTLNAEVIGGEFEVRGYLNPTEEKMMVTGDQYLFPAYFTLVLKIA